MDLSGTNIVPASTLYIRATHASSNIDAAERIAPLITSLF